MPRSKIHRAPGETYRVKAHDRRYPRKAKPHWIAAIVDRGGREVTFVATKNLPEIPDLGRIHANPLPDQAEVFLRRDLTKVFGEQIEAGTVVLLKVD